MAVLSIRCATHSPCACWSAASLSKRLGICLATTPCKVPAPTFACILRRCARSHYHFHQILIAEAEMKNSDLPLNFAIARYLTIRRTLGRQYVNEERVLTSLSQFLRERDLEDLEHTGFDTWCRSLTRLHANTRRGRLGIVRNFCLYRRR